MTGHGSVMHEPQPLAALVEKSPLLYWSETGRIEVSDKIDTPLDEFEVPDRVELMKRVMGSLSSRHIWTGDYDLHHVAWPRMNYAHYVDSEGERFGTRYRNAPSLRITMPRQLHEYVHAVTLVPKVPSPDVMRQYALEHGQVGSLYDTIKSYKTDEEIERFGFPKEAGVCARLDSYHEKIEAMEPGVIGIMPDKEYLYNLEIDSARRVLRSIARANGISNSRHAIRAFFGEAKTAA